MNENFASAVHVSDVQKITNKVSVPATVSDDDGAFDLDVGAIFLRILDGTNGTLSLDNETVKQVFVVILQQDPSGSRSASWFAGIKWADGAEPSLSSSANVYDSFIFIVLGAGSYLGFVMATNQS